MNQQRPFLYGKVKRVDCFCGKTTIRTVRGKREIEICDGCKRDVQPHEISIDDTGRMLRELDKKNKGAE